MLQPKRQDGETRIVLKPEGKGGPMARTEAPGLLEASIHAEFLPWCDHRIDQVFCFPIIQEQEQKEVLFYTSKEELLEANTNILRQDCTNTHSPQNYHVIEIKLYDFIICITTLVKSGVNQSFRCWVYLQDSIPNSGTLVLSKHH